MATTITRRRASLAAASSETLPVSTGTVRRHINTPGNDEKTRRRLYAAVVDLRGRIRKQRAASRPVTATRRVS